MQKKGLNTGKDGVSYSYSTQWTKISKNCSAARYILEPMDIAKDTSTYLRIGARLKTVIPAIPFRKLSGFGRSGKRKIPDKPE